MNKRIEKLTPKQEFLQYLFEITKSEKLREYGAEFFSLFENRYKGLFLKKEDFDTLKVLQPNGSFVVYEQDVVKDLFRKRYQVSYAEVYVYLFKKNIKSFNSFLDSDYEVTGYVDTINQKINIKYASELKEHELCNQINKNIENKVFDLRLKTIIFHELSHVFEIKNYKNGKYLINGLSDKIFYQNQNQTYSELPKAPKKPNKYCSSKQLGDYYYYVYNDIGKDNIAEILNEDFTLNVISKNVVLYYNTIDSNKKFIEKIAYGQEDIEDFEFTNKYYNNYDILLLLKFTLLNFNYKSCRLNSSEIISEINNFDIDNELILFARIVYKGLKLNIDLEQNKATKHVNWGNNFEKASIYDLITYGVGFQVLHNSEQNDFNFKTISQTLLVNAFKNKTFAELADKKIKKDVDYFNELNNKLYLINGFMLFRNQPIENTDIYPFKEFSVKKMSEVYGEDLYSQQFVQLNHLITVIKDYISFLPAEQQLKINDCMTFFEKQQILDDNLELKLKNTNKISQKLDLTGLTKTKNDEVPKLEK